MMSSPACEDRPPHDDGVIFMELLAEDRFANLGVLFASGPNWKKSRRFAVKTLHYFGMATNTVESLVLEEVKYMLDYVK